LYPRGPIVGQLSHPLRNFSVADKSIPQKPGHEIDVLRNKKFRWGFRVTPQDCLTSENYQLIGFPVRSHIKTLTVQTPSISQYSMNPRNTAVNVNIPVSNSGEFFASRG